MLVQLRHKLRTKIRPIFLFLLWLQWTLKSHQFTKWYSILFILVSCNKIFHSLLIIIRLVMYQQPPPWDSINPSKPMFSDQMCPYSQWHTKSWTRLYETYTIFLASINKCYVIVLRVGDGALNFCECVAVFE